MKYFAWSSEKNELLKLERGVGFEMIADAILDGRVLDRVKHPNQKKYPNQMIYVVEIGNYAFVVPYVEDDEKIFFKTVYPSREATKKYLKHNV